MTEGNHDIVFSGNSHVNDEHEIELEAKVQHLACFSGGMVGIGSMIFDSQQDMPIARKLVDCCIWAYGSTVTGLMPEIFHTVPCTDPCSWDVSKWNSAIASSLDRVEGGNDTRSEQADVEEKIRKDRLTPGVTAIDDRRYILRCVFLISSRTSRVSRLRLAHVTMCAGPRQSSPSLFSTASRATFRTLTRLGTCSRPLGIIPGPTWQTQHSMMSRWPTLQKQIEWKVFGLRRP